MFEPQAISAADINDKIARIRARHVLLISDSCYAGGLSRSGEAGGITLDKTVPDLAKRVSNTTQQVPELNPLRGDAGASDDGGARVFFRH